MYVRDSGSHTTRSSVKNGLYLTTCKQRTVHSSGARIWNSINTDIHNQQSLNSFKNAYIKDYFSV